MNSCHNPRHCYSDIEVACVVPPYGPGCDCDNNNGMTINVTEDDIARWNWAVSGVYQLSGLSAKLENIDLDALTSATYWNGTYETVNANSATWNSFGEALDKITEISNTLDNKQDKFFVDTNSITGTGTEDDPYGVKNYTFIKDLAVSNGELLAQLFKGQDQIRQWTTTGEYNDLLKATQKLEVSAHDLNEGMQNNYARIIELYKKLGLVDKSIAGIDADIIEIFKRIAENKKDIKTNATNIKSNTEKINANTKNIQANTNSIQKNAKNISKNAEDIAANAKKIDQNAADIKTNTNAIATNSAKIAQNSAKIDVNSANIAANSARIDAIEDSMIGYTRIGNLQNNYKNLTENNKIYFDYRE